MSISPKGGPKGAFRLATTSRTLRAEPQDEAWPGRTADEGILPTNISCTVLNNSLEVCVKKS
ncbi:MAG: hypothetical protein ACUVV0_13095 [Anaerolineae bacterium]